VGSGQMRWDRMWWGRFGRSWVGYCGVAVDWYKVGWDRVRWVRFAEVWSDMGSGGCGQAGEIG
jgi:hypothetical protein